MPDADEHDGRRFGPLVVILAAGAAVLVVGGVLLLRQGRPAPRATATSLPPLGRGPAESAPLPRPPDPVTPKTLAPIRETRHLTDHLQVGQRYEFTSKLDQATMAITTTEVWTVRAITPNVAVVYDVETVTRIAMKNPPPAMMPMRPRRTRRRRQRYSLLQVDPSLRASRPEPIHEELIVVSGVDFDCEVHLQSGNKTWTARRFPGVIKTSSKRMTRELVRIVSPR